MDVLGYFWIFLVILRYIFEHSSVFLDIRGYSLIFLDNPGYSWIFVDVRGYSRIFWNILCAKFIVSFVDSGP